ncbi:methyltransferase-like protein 22 isoform X3 [Zophobas morio]|uniref:methyltransferase-like protein 22 isoform X3 n=1 Tax=Zophobas morio TaxID=2755281 RepID=UPI003083ED70
MIDKQTGTGNGPRNPWRIAMDEEVCQVSSELYTEHDYGSSSKPMINPKNTVSKFKFKYPPPPPKVDSDGDLIVRRKKKNVREKLGVIEIEHSKSTVLDLVGLQIWRGALLLADWLLYNRETFKEGHYILELGSGVGLSSIVAAMFTPVFCTDINKGGLLKLIKGNALRNSHLTKHPITVLELDFLSQVLPREIVATLEKTPIVIAADVVYDNVITQAFVRTMGHLLSKPPKRSIYVALEKRFVFTIADCDAVAPCYEYFVECLQKLENIEMEEVPLDFPQYFQYDRVKELVLWKISSTFEDEI